MVAEVVLSTRSRTNDTARGESTTNLRRYDRGKGVKPFQPIEVYRHCSPQMLRCRYTSAEQPPARAHHLRSRCSVLYGLAGLPWVLLRACGRSAGGDPKGHPGQPNRVLVDLLWQGSPQKPNRYEAAFFLAHTPNQRKENDAMKHMIRITTKLTLRLRRRWHDPYAIVRDPALSEAQSRRHRLL